MSKLKTMLAIFVAGFIGIMSNPEMLTASDSVTVLSLNNDKVVETVVKPEPEVVTAGFNSQDTAYYKSAYVDSVYKESVYSLPENYISINGYIIPLAYTDTTAENAGSAQLAWYYKSDKHIYGHNYDYVFGSLDWAHDGGYLDGMPFTVVMNGVANYYTVATHRVYDRLDAYTLGYYGQTTSMYPIVNANLDGAYYRMTIMTCYNGSSQRLVLYAN